MNKTLTFAVDFDGCLCEYAFPGIGEQTENQKILFELVKSLQSEGHKIILWTCRGEPRLQQAIDWCEKRGLTFDSVNENQWFKKESGPSPKVVADYYIDDKALSFPDRESNTLDTLRQLRSA